MTTSPFLELDAPEIVDHDAKLMAGLQEHVAQSEAPARIPGLWTRFKAIYPLPHAIEGGLYGVCTNVDFQDNCSFDYLACVEVSSKADMPEGVTVLELPPARHAVFTYSGPIWNIRQVYRTIYNQWLPASGHTPAHAATLERYTREHDPETGETTFEIWLPIQA